MGGARERYTFLILSPLHKPSVLSMLRYPGSERRREREREREREGERERELSCHLPCLQSSPVVYFHWSYVLHWDWWWAQELDRVHQPSRQGPHQEAERRGSIISRRRTQANGGCGLTKARHQGQGRGEGGGGRERAIMWACCIELHVFM